MKSKSPYFGLPDRQFWKKEPGISDPRAFDPVGEVPFGITATDKIVTAGSCFAQHVANFLRKAGYNYLVTEPCHPAFSEDLAKRFNYGTFTARYGNLYTARQLKQLLQRAHGEFTPLVDHWPRGEDGRVVDPFRPQIQPDGFVSAAELAADRVQHFAAIRTAIRDMDVFVFTLGLTECWADRRDGAVYPLAPGVAGGTWDPEIVEFRNFGYEETLADMVFSLEYIRRINPNVRIILTVSPVPLNATYEDRHVFLSTTWSKAVLRLVAEALTERFDRCLYFPSYEVITAPHVRGAYFAADCREVTEKGVEHVMGLFFRHLSSGKAVAAPTAAKAAREAAARHLADMQCAIDVLCDEEAIRND